MRQVRLALAAAALALSGGLVVASLHIVPAGHRGVRTTLGEPSPQVLGEGLHVGVPGVHRFHHIDTRLQKDEVEGVAASRDLQRVEARVAINYHVDPAAVPRLFREVGTSTPEVAMKIVLPALQESVKAVTAQFTAEELISNRTRVRDSIVAQLRERMERHGLVLDEFSIVNFAFSKSFSEAIEAKVRAEQDKLRAERDLQRIEVEAEQRLAMARAEAESLRLQRAHLSPELLRLREVENVRRAIEKWNGALPTVTGAATPFIDIGSPVR
jgi:regulator of protease activity HflC (stomatin/prohibitin superfamily)